MTAYQGGKKRLGKEIHDVIIELERSAVGKKLPYFEPFCGMCGVLVHFGKDGDRKLSACDINQDIVMMWKTLQKGWKPPTKCTKTRYDELKYSKKHSAERGFIGVVCSFSGMFFKGGFRSKSTQHDFVKAGARGVLNASQHLKKVDFMASRSYDQFSPKGCLIYCDPPYRNNKVANDTFQNFDHDKFWEVMREWSKTNLVIISEKIAPKDFKRVWAKEYKVSFLRVETSENIKKSYNECLFLHKSWF